MWPVGDELGAPRQAGGDAIPDGRWHHGRAGPNQMRSPHGGRTGGPLVVLVPTAGQAGGESDCSGVSSAAGWTDRQRGGRRRRAPRLGATPSRLMCSSGHVTVTLYENLMIVRCAKTMKRQAQGISSGMYRYTHRCESGVNIHDVFLERSVCRVLFSYMSAICFLANVCHTFLPKESLCHGSFWSVSFSATVAKCLQYKPVKKSWTLMIGRVHRMFVPISKILKPVMNECVTPVTCYWSLALLLRDEDETMLVFQKLHPLVKLLLPICKALRAFTNSGIISPSVVL